MELLRPYGCMHLHQLQRSRVFHKLSNDHFLHNSVEQYNLLRPLRWFVQTRCIFLISPDHCTELYLIKSKNFMKKYLFFDLYHFNHQFIPADHIPRSKSISSSVCAATVDLHLQLECECSWLILDK